MDFNEFLRTIGSALVSVTRWIGRKMQAQMVHAVGGAARARVIFLFGAVLALASAKPLPSNWQTVRYPRARLATG